MSMTSEIDLLRRYDDERCSNCGQTEKRSGVPATTIVLDWRGPELVCDTCVANHDWSDWTFEPILNLYTRTPPAKLQVQADTDTHTTYHTDGAVGDTFYRD